MLSRSFARSLRATRRFTPITHKFSSFHSSSIFRDDESAPAPLDSNVQEIVDKILTLNIPQTLQLVDHLKEKFGYVESQMVAAAPAGGGAAAAPEEVEEKVEQTIFTVKLESFDAKDKIKVIKEVRAITGLGLKQSKELVESAPTTVKADLPKADAEALAEKLKAVGAECKLE